MANRGRRRGPPPFRRRQDQPPPEADTLGTRELVFQEKKMVIEMKSNPQGKFVNIFELELSGGDDPHPRGRIRLSSEVCPPFRTMLNEFVAEYERLPPPGEITDSERLKTDSFQGVNSRRRYYVDLRQNQRGRFVKVTMLAGKKTFVAIPGEGLVQFRDEFTSLLDEFASVEVESAPPSSLPASKNVSVDRKTFYFDVDKNERGVFMKVSEVLSNGNRPGYINIPHSCWDRVGDIFKDLAKELPYTDESSGSDDN